MTANKRTELRLAGKRFSIIFGLLVLVLGAVFFLFYNTESHNRRELVKREASNEVAHMLGELSAEFRLILSDLMFLSDQNELQQALNTNEATDWGDVASEYLSFSARRRIYDQIRFIDETGTEIVRIDFDDGKPVIVPNEQLQSKAKRYYFEDTFKLAQGEVFVSPMDLNIERGEIEQPLKQTIRIGTPILDRDGHKRGVLILNYLAENMTDHLEPAAGGLDQFMLLNSDGYWLHSPNPEDEWGFMYPARRDRTFGNSFPEAWLAITTDDSGQFFNADGLFTFVTIYPLSEGQKSSTGAGPALEPSAQQIEAKEYYWKIVSLVRSSVLSAAAGPLLTRTLIVFVITLVAAAAGSWTVALAMVRRKQTQEALREMEERYGDFFKNAPVGFHMLGPDKMIADVNQTELDMLGYSYDEIVGRKSWSDLIVPEQRQAFSEHWEAISTPGEVTNLEYTLVRKDGRHVPVLLNASTRFDSEGGMINTRGSVLDITKRKEAEEDLKKYKDQLEIIVEERTGELTRAREELEQMFDLSIDMIGVTDMATGCFVRINPAFEKTLGLSAEELLSRPFMDFVHPDDKESTMAAWSGMTTRGAPVLNFENRYQCKDGSYKWLAWNAYPSLEQGLVFAVARDITEHRWMEQKLLTTEKLAVLGQLAGGIGHELRNPLAAIKNAVYYLNMVLEKPESDVQEMLQVMDTEIAGAESVINSLLDYTRAKPPARQEIKAAEIIRKTLSGITVPRRVSAVEELDEDAALMADPIQLGQVVRNIVTNAIQAMPDGGRLTVRCDVAEPDWIEISVTDTGSGIRPEDVDRIFEPLFTSRATGIGLGLPISKMLIEGHGGTISVDSELGRGSTFLIRLPVGNGQRV